VKWFTHAQAAGLARLNDVQDPFARAARLPGDGGSPGGGWVALFAAAAVYAVALTLSLR